MSPSNFLLNPLTREEFSSAIQRGLGRALIHVKKFGIEEVKDIVLNACLHNLTWDPVCEGERAKWLFDLFADTKYCQDFSDEIVRVLATETDESNLDQLFDIAREMALAGNEQAKAAIGKRALEIARIAAEGDALGAEEWMEVAGIDGFLDLVRIYGKSLIENRDAWVPEYDVPEYQSTVFERAKKEPEIKSYLDYVAANAKEPTPRKSREERFIKYREDSREQYPLERILRDANNKKGDYPSFYVTFGKYATKEELDTVYSKLLAEQDNDIRIRLLWVFCRAQLPGIDDCLFFWAFGEQKIRSATVSALAQVKSPRIHDLAVHKLNNDQLVEALELFINNYDEKDASSIEKRVLEVKPPIEQADTIVFNIIHITENNPDKALESVLKWSYSATPCSNCREKVVKLLKEMDILSEEIVEECKYDAYESIRAIAKQ
jgi:hypothetical protein